MIVNGFINWATRVDGVPDKIYSDPNLGLGIACHSVVGRESEFQDGIPNRFLSTDKDSDGQYTAMAAASSMFVLRESGELIQMYPIWASTWTSGGYEGNTRFWAIEAEGGLIGNTTEKLTVAAEDTFVRLVTEWEDYTSRFAVPGNNVLQHKQIAVQYGYLPTACASDRYSNAWDRITRGERYTGIMGITAEESEAIARRVFDEYTPIYFIDLMKKYFCEVATGDFSDMPDPAVLDAIATTAMHKHSPKGGANRPL